jgi:phosphoglycerate dehydrogenase-like enzyme
MRVVFHYDCGAWLCSRLAELRAEGLDIALCPEDDEACFANLLAEADILWHVLRPVTAAHIASAPRLRLIQKIGVGVNTIDLDAASRRGIAVCNMPGTNSRAVAEMTLALLLAVKRKVVAFDSRLRQGRWRWPAEWQDALTEIGGERIGFAGFGAVPRLLAPVMEALGAEVVYTNRRAYDDVGYAWLSKEEFLASCDVVSLHLPATPQDPWLDRAAILHMKPGAILLNTGRGSLVDQAALTEALASGRLAGAGLDVFSEEPVPADDPILRLGNVVLAPHVAWFTRGTLERSLVVAVENCRRLKRGEALLNRVA